MADLVVVGVDMPNLFLLFRPVLLKLFLLAVEVQETKLLNLPPVLMTVLWLLVRLV